MRYLILHESFGVYIGGFLGLGFWSNLDTANQDYIVTFDSIDNAKRYIEIWAENNNPDNYTFFAVESDQEYLYYTELFNTILEEHAILIKNGLLEERLDDK